ncbi:MAG: HD-GYP domain-containing protein [Deltaproteobacteria bacterium]
MVEFSKILKKVRGSEKERSRREDRDPGPKAVPYPRPQEHARPEPPPPPPRAAAGPPAAPEGVPQERREEEPFVLKPVKSLFSQQRAQEQLEAESRREDAAAPAQSSPRSSSLEKERLGDFPFVEPGAKCAPQEQVRDLYERMLACVRPLFGRDAQAARPDAHAFMSLMGEVVGVLGSGDEGLIELAITYLLKDEASYLPQHSVNVTVLSLAVGQGAGLDAPRMEELGLTALLHDIGMAAYQDMARVRRPLTPQEFAKIKEHVEAGQQMLREIYPPLSETVLAAQYEIHERADGSGYPQGRRAIHEYAKIIALADTFESMIHPRPFRSRYSIMDVYKDIFATKHKYDAALIKVLIDRLGFFPTGSYIQLNSKEVGRVVGQNHRSPLRPIARILWDEAGRRLSEDDIKDVDLMRYPTLHVVRCFLEEDAEAAHA